MRFLALLPLTLALASATPADPSPTYAPCGGKTSDGPQDCPDGHTCIDDPRKDGCGMSCDQPGICVPDEGLDMCSGIAGIKCPEGRVCTDDPTDACDPQSGGADCAGICV